MSNDQLHLDLTDLAEEVVVVNLHDRVLRSSRRIGIQRTVTTSVAALAAIAAISAGAFAAIPHGSNAQMPAGTKSSAAASTPPSNPATTAVQITGTTYYAATNSSSTQVFLHRVTNSGDHISMTFPKSAGECPYYTATVSPDGTRVEWITQGGQLFVANVNGAHAKLVASHLNCMGGNAGIWRSNNYFVGPLANGKPIGVDAATGTITDSDVAQAGVASPNGRFIAGITPSGQHYVVPANGSKHQNFSYTLPNTGAVYDGWSVRSISNDGHYVAIGGNPTDSGRNTSSIAIVDVRTGAAMHLPVTGQITHIEFLADNTVLVTTNSQYVLLNSSLHKIASKPTTLGAVVGEWLSYLP